MVSVRFDKDGVRRDCIERQYGSRCYRRFRLPDPSKAVSKTQDVITLASYDQLSANCAHKLYFPYSHVAVLLSLRPRSRTRARVLLVARVVAHFLHVLHDD